MKTPIAARRAAAAMLLAAAGTAASAHDTWFAPLPDGGAELRLALGTGARFPGQETPIAAEYLRDAGCRAAGQALPLQPHALDAHAIELRSSAAAASCWVASTPFELELAPEKIALYLDEVRPPPAMRAAWAALHARGLPWRERYIKHARFAAMQPDAATETPSGMAMDVLLRRDGAEHVFQVLRDGQPLADFAVELRSERSAFGIWRRTDASGRLRFTPPFGGQWLLRGVDLRLADDDATRWDSRFVTLAFEVAEPVRAERAGQP